MLASNQPDQFDWAINDRLDGLISFDLPGEEERLRMLKLYFSLFILSPPRLRWWKKPKLVYNYFLIEKCERSEFGDATRVTQKTYTSELYWLVLTNQRVANCNKPIFRCLQRWVKIYVVQVSGISHVDPLPVWA